MLVVTHSDYALSIALNETDEPKTPPLDPAKEGGNEFVGLIEGLDKLPQRLPGDPPYPAQQPAPLRPLRRAGRRCYAVYANVRNVRFNEMGIRSPPSMAPPACGKSSR